MGVKERKERERRQRANDILEAARRSFEAKGFLNTTLQDVAKEAEISVGLIYRYFQSKEDIFASLALKGAEELDEELEEILTRANGKPRPAASAVLGEIADSFFSFYGPYGEYFDMLMYSYKGMKQIQVHGATVTKLMSVTLLSLDRIKTYIQDSPEFKARDEDDALQTVFLLWGILLGCHKLFDGTGRGHLFAFSQKEFMRNMIHQVLNGIAPAQIEAPSATRPTRVST